MKIESHVNFGDSVVIDGDESLVAIVTGFQFRTPEYHTIEVSWIHNGDSKCAWIEGWRATKVERNKK